MSSSVSILGIVNEELLLASDNGNIPGSDFWRRIDSIQQRFEAADFQVDDRGCSSITLSKYLKKQIQYKEPLIRSTHLQRKQLEFEGTELTASEVLFGGLELGSDGELTAREAALAEHKNTLFVLNDAPWHDVSFQVHLANILIRRGLETGSRCLALPSEFHLLATTTPAEQLAHKLESLAGPPIHEAGNWLPLNQGNFDLIFNTLTITHRHLKRTRPAQRMAQLQELATGIEVTSSLSKAQWTKLTHFLSSSSNMRPMSLRIRVQQQPVSVPSHLTYSAPGVYNSQVEYLSGQLSIADLRQTDPLAHIEVISPQTDARELFERILMTSSQQRMFERQPTDLSQALKTGQPVIITGLESNLKAQQVLESLLISQPFIPLQGDAESTGSGSIKVQWRNPDLAISPLWQDWLRENSADSPADQPVLPSPQPPQSVDWDQPELLRETISQTVLNHPLVYLEGPPGSGKSYIAHKVAKALSGPNPVFKLTMGPDIRQEDLLGEQMLRKIVSATDDQHQDDHETVFVDGPLLQWAKYRGDNKDLVVFIADEGNLLHPDFQNLLVSLLANPPFISANGDHFPLTPEHRLIITGNSLSMTGRHLIPELKEQAATIQFSAMSHKSLAQQIVLPFLKKVSGKTDDDALHAWTANVLLEQLEAYQTKVPNYPLSARDMLDVLSRLQFYLGQLVGQPHEEVEQTIQQSLYDSLSGQGLGEIPPPMTSAAVLSKQNEFAELYQQLTRQNLKVHLNNSSTQHLAWRIWLELERIAQEAHHQSHAGRHAMVIEGPAGRGKDLILNRLIQQWQKHWQEQGLSIADPVHITAGFNNWDTLKQEIMEAKTQGRIVIVSELNLIPGHYLEGVLNDILTGFAAPGFFLFATVNPVQYTGRHAFSNALASRFTQLKLMDYTLDDLETIAKDVSANPYAQTVSGWHNQLVTYLKQNSAPAIPALSKMVNFLDELNRDPSEGLDSTRQRFMKTYRLYIQNRWQPESSGGRSLPPMVTTEQGSNDHNTFITAEGDGQGSNKNTFIFSTHIRNLYEQLIAVTKRCLRQVLFSGTDNGPAVSRKKSSPLSGIDSNVALNAGKTFGNVQQIFFGGPKPEKYRTLIRHLHILDDGGVFLKPAPYHGYPVQSVPSQSEGMSGQEHHYFAEQSIMTDTPTALGSLFPREQLLALSTDAAQPIELRVEYDPYQGRYFVTADSQARGQRKVNVQFAIQETKNRYSVEAFPLPKPGSSAISERAREQISTFLSNHPGIEQQINIEPGHSTDEKVKRIVQFTQNFSASNTQPESAPSGSNIDTLLFLLQHQMGACRHRSYVAAMLGAYFDIPVRLVSNDIHTFVEFSVDGGFNWASYHLGGYPAHYKLLPAGADSLKGDLKKLLELTLTGMTDNQNLDRIIEKYSEPDSDFGFHYIRDVIESIEALANPDEKYNALGYFGKLLLKYHVSPDRMETIPYLLGVYPEYRPALTQWMRQRYKFTLQEPIVMEDVPETSKALQGEPFDELEQLIIKPSSGFQKTWKYHPPGQLQLNRLLENKPAFASISEQQQFQRRKVIFNVADSLLNDPDKEQHYKNIVAQKFGSDHIDDVLGQESLQFTYHLDRLIGVSEGNGAIVKRLMGVYRWAPDIEEKHTPFGYSSEKKRQPMGEKIPPITLLVPNPDHLTHSWLWLSTMSKTEPGIPLQIIPKWFPESYKEWQDAVVVDEEMLHRLFCNYLESLSSGHKQ